MKESEVVSGIKRTRLDTWEQFHEYIRQHYSNAPAFIYRGQGDSTWKVESCLDRLETSHSSYPNHHGEIPEEFGVPPAERDTHLRAFKLAARGKLRFDSTRLSEDEWWALAQQHGLATPMLDWSLSPYVAMYFAFENKCPGGESPKFRAVYCVSSNCLRGGDAKSPQPYMPDKDLTPRLSTQLGVYLKMPKGCSLEDWVKQSFPDDGPKKMGKLARRIFERIEIPNNNRIECLKELNKMNINRLSLFPDLDGAAQYINRMWELDFDTALGHLPEQLGTKT